MFAVIKTGGKQYKVAANDILKVEKLQGEPGETVKFTDVLIINQDGSLKVGTPLLANTSVQATIVDQIRDDKVIIFKKNRRHNYRRKNGHRQYLTVIQVTDILPEGAKVAAPKGEKKAAAEAKEPSKSEKKPPSKKPASSKVSAPKSPKK